MALVLEWAADHRDELMEDWNLCSRMQTPKAIEPPEIIPELKHTVPWRVTSLNVLSDARLRVTFVDGVGGEVHMQSFLNNPIVDGTIFELLRDPGTFAQAQVVLGAVQWPNGADLAPDAMYDAIREHGVWVLD